MIAPLLLFFPLLTAAYNLKTESAIIYQAPSLNSMNNDSLLEYTRASLFGYSVLLSSEKRILSDGSTVLLSWLLVGAPKANYSGFTRSDNKSIQGNPGIVYRCQIPNECGPINVEHPNDEEGFIDQVLLSSLIEKKYGWLGAAMSLHEPTKSLTVCAPRTIVRIYNQIGRTYHKTMHGVCYNGKLYSGVLRMEEKNFTTYDFTAKFWYNPLNGFAVHYPNSQKRTTGLNVPIIGSPTHELYGSVHKMGQNNTVELPLGDDLSQFGYALTSGYYFNKEQLMVAGGAPGWQYVGQVAIMDHGIHVVNLTISGTEVGESFGSSLASGDLNGDGLDDLIVGAPHWKNDNGRVHIFFGNKAGFFDADIFLEGRLDDAQFGYAVTCGDLDDDGFKDLIVGAPWEYSGVIYVYNGDAELQEHRLLEPSQRISAKDIKNNILRFGFSLSNLVDIDGNSHSDVAVGAYGSGHAVILRSRPAVITYISLTTLTKTLPRNSTNLALQVCLNMRPLPPYGKMWTTSILITIDEYYKRLDHTYTIIRFENQPPGHCITENFRLEEDIRNYLDAIEVVATAIGSCDEEETFSSLLCPVTYRARKATARMKLSFDIGCSMNEICHASTSLNMTFQGISKSTWIIGSEDPSLVLWITNVKEPAYLTTATFDIPKGIYLKSALRTCQEEEHPEGLRVTCDVGNPLVAGKQEKITLDLNMNGMHNGSADGTMLNFSVKIKTRSVNEGNTSIDIPLHLKANVSVGLIGKAHGSSYYFKYNETATNISFKHTYQISKFGATPISEALLTINIPYKFHGLEFLRIRHNPRVSVQARFYDCSITGVSMTKRLIDDKLSINVSTADDFRLETAASHSRIRRLALLNNVTAVRRPDIISHTALVNFTEPENETNAQSEFYIISDSKKLNITYLNCSTPDVTCGQVTCKIPSLRTTQDVGNLHLQMVVEGSVLAGGAEETEKSIHITTEASVRVLDPKMKSAVPGAGIAIPVTTTLHYAANMRSEISIFIILGSLLLGLLALCIIAGVLSRIGFFKRLKKEELDILKKGEPLQASSCSLEQHDVVI